MNKTKILAGNCTGVALYPLYIADIPQQDDTLIATFANNTAIISQRKDCVIATEKLQEAVNAVIEWATKWNKTSCSAFSH